MSESRMKTGLLVPPERPRTLTSYSNAEGILSLDEIIDIVRDPNRVPIWEICPRKVFHREQINNGCNGFATAAAEAHQRVVEGRDPVILSGDFCYAQMSGGRDGGSLLHDARIVIQEIGSCPDDMVEHGVYRKQQIPREAYEAAKLYRGRNAYACETKLELYTALARRRMCVVAVQVNNSYKRVDSSGFAGPSHGRGNHSVCAADLVWSKNRLKIYQLQSWYWEWGWDCACLIDWENHLVQTARYHEFWALGSSYDNPNESNPPTPKAA